MALLLDWNKMNRWTDGWMETVSQSGLAVPTETCWPAGCKDATMHSVRTWLVGREQSNQTSPESTHDDDEMSISTLKDIIHNKQWRHRTTHRAARPGPLGTASRRQDGRGGVLAWGNPRPTASWSVCDRTRLWSDVLTFQFLLGFFLSVFGLKSSTGTFPQVFWLKFYLHNAPLMQISWCASWSSYDVIKPLSK